MSLSALPFLSEAVWIGSDHPFDLREVYLRFRGAFTIEEIPAKAEFFISADSRYRLWINGSYVASGPARGYPHKQVVDQHDLKKYLQPGENILAVQVYQPGYSHFAYVHRGGAGLLAVLRCDDNTVVPGGWRTCRDLSFSPSVPQASIYLSGVEVRDLSQAEDWIAPDYDDSGWAAARPVAPVGAYPWLDLPLRSVPLLTEVEITPTLVQSRTGDHDALPDPHTALTQGWGSAAPHSWEPDDEGWFEVTLDSGESAFWLYDLGRGYSCRGWAEVLSASGYERLFISYSEKPGPDGVYLSDPETYCRMRMTDSFKLRAGDQVAESFALRGGRLILFQLSGPTQAHIRFHVTVAEYPLRVSRRLSSPDPVLSKILTLCENTLRACLLDGFVDNPWRESAQWVGDALPDALSMSAISDDVCPLRRVIELAVEGAYPDGVLPGVVPSEAHAYTVLDFNFVWVELLELYDRLSQDGAFVEQMWPPLVRLIDRFSEDLNGDGLLVSQTGRRLFIDWSPIARHEPSASYNLHFLLALQKAIMLAQKYGKPADEWRYQAESLQAAVRGAFWVDGRWVDDLGRTTFSQQATALALLTGSNTSDEKPALLDALTARSLDLDDSHSDGKMVLASPYVHHRVFTALREGGRSDDVIAIIRRRWGRWVEAGSPTTWENWDVDFPDGSECHGFSAHPLYHLSEIAREGSPLIREQRIETG